MTKNPYFSNLIRSMIVGFFIVFIAVSVGCSSTKTRESTGQFIDDAAMTAKVKAKLFDDPVVRGTAISVETFKGTVQLSGFANSKEEANKAESLAKSVEGVRAVRNSIVLKQ
jgi:osmotically-inducible protein OsmY